MGNNKSAMVTTRVSPETRDALQRQAESEHRTISQQVAMILTEYVTRIPQGLAGRKEMTEQIASDVQPPRSAPCAP